MRVKSLRIRFSGGIVGVTSTPTSLPTSGEPPFGRTTRAQPRDVGNGCKSGIGIRKDSGGTNRKG